jgi:hypothetical protein
MRGKNAALEFVGALFYDDSCWEPSSTISVICLK